MTPLYTRNDNYTEAALALVGEIARAIGPIFKKYIDLGFSIRDIGHVALHAVASEEYSQIFGWGIQRRKNEGHIAANGEVAGERPKNTRKTD
jgi:hypothetical protein